MLNLRLEMSVVTEWLKANKLTLNVQKSKYVIFGTRAKLQGVGNVNLDVSGEPLERTNKMKYLGMILDEKLNFDEHVDYICNKAVNKLGILRKARDFLDLETSVLLYKSLVLPHFDYCDIVYASTSVTNLQRLQVMQNSACRTMLLCDKYTPTSQMHTDLKLLPLEKRRNLHISMDCFNHINNAESSLSKYFVKKNTRTVRGGDKYQLPHLKTTMGRKAYSYRGPEHWSQLPEDMKQITSKQLFKSEMTKSLLRDINHPT